MLGRNEFKDLCTITALFQQQRPQAVRNCFRCSLCHHTVFEHTLHELRCRHLPADLLMATRSRDDDLSTRPYAIVKRVVRRGVTGVKGDKDVDLFDRETQYVVSDKPQAGEFRRLGYLITKLDQLGT